METFHFQLDQKCSIWYRTKFEIHAEDFETAREIAIEKVKEGLEEPWEPLYDTVETMSIRENLGEPTEELYSLNPEEFDTIYTNKIK
jgi:hypothetical protein